MLGCLVFWRFDDLLVVWLFSSLVGWLVGLLCFVLFYLLLLWSSIGDLEKSMHRKVLLSKAPFNDRGTLTWSGKTMHFWFQKWELVSGPKRRLGVWVLGLVLLVVYLRLGFSRWS